MTPVTAETPDEIKARGAFYTPIELTNFLATWAVRSSADRVLEPSCGDGAFIAAIQSRMAQLGLEMPGDHLLGVEREAAEAHKAQTLAPSADIRTLDFFDLDPAGVRPVDATVGNPPYIRYHGFTGADRAKALARASAQGVGLTNLASSWAHFVVHATAFLKPNGRLALVLPAELLHTDYGAPVREFLMRRFSSVVVIAFDKMVFADIQVDAVLLLASHDDDHGIRVIRLRDKTLLAAVDLTPGLGEQRGIDLRWSGAVDIDAGRVYLEAFEQRRLQRLGQIASVDIGFVSGANDYFVLQRDRAQALGLPRSVLVPTVRRPSDVPGLATKDDEVQLLLNLKGETLLDDSVRAYLAHGEAIGISQRYKPRSRKHWYSVPLPTKRAQAFMPYMSHHGPRVIVNRHDARSSNLLHGIALGPRAPSAEALAVAMASSLTLLSAEIEGRAYGGGVLKLETREAERLAIPILDVDLTQRLEDAHAEADEHLRAGRIKDSAALADGILGLDHVTLWAAYAVFRDRRLTRANGRRRTQRFAGTSLTK
jgi:adenine-specific DNA-methyltransferase